MIAWPNYHFLGLHLLGRLVLFLRNDYLRKVLDNIAERSLSKDIFPKIGGHRIFLNNRITSTSIHTTVEWQEPRVLSRQGGTHPYLLVIHGKVDGTAFLLQEQFLRVTFRLVLSDGVLIGLPCIVVLQFEGSERKTVDEDYKIYLIGILGRIHHLSDDAEDILLVGCLGTRIELRREWIIEVEGIAIELIALAKHVHNSSLTDFS